MTFSTESNQLRAKRLADNIDAAYSLGKKHGQAEALQRAITMLTYLEKTSGTNRPGVSAALEIVRTINVR